MKRKLKSLVIYALVLVSLVCVLTVSSQKSQALNLNRENIFYFLKNNMGLSTASAVGILANIEKESSFNPNKVGDSGTSYGICQWHNSRWQSLKDFCAENGYDWTSLTGQLYYLEKELETSYPNTYRMIREVENNIQGTYDAAYYFCRYYEIPANAEAAAQKRGLLAQNTYWPIYGYTEGFAAPELKLDAEYTSVSSRVPFSFSWNNPGGKLKNYKLCVVRCDNNSAGYDWNDMKEYTISSDKKTQSISAAELPGGNYLAYIRACGNTSGERSDFSNFLYFSVYDELIFESEKPAGDMIFDAYTVNEIPVSGWGFSTGRYPVEFYAQIDDGEKVHLPSAEREEISSKYPVFCSSSEIGYSWKIPISDISNGEHTLSIYVESETINGLMSQNKFTVLNSHVHSFTNYVYNKDALYSSDGTKTAKCDLCTTTDTVTAKGTKLTLPAPSKVTSTKTEKTVTLNWKKVPGATGYRINRYDPSKKAWITVGYTTSLSYTVKSLKSGTKYSFAIRAYVDEGEYGEIRVISDSYKQHKTATRPALVKNVKAAQSTNSVTLTWNKSSGATGYRVYRYDTAKKKWITVINKTTARKVTIKKLKKGTKYTFSVKPYITTESGDVWAESGTRIKTATKTAAPTIKVASPSKGKATVTWSNVSGETGYQVYYSTKKSGGYKKLGNYKANKLKTTKSGFTRGKTYYFKVRAYIKTNSGYVYSSYSSVKSVKIK
ncbi:MAG: fibronectin type III domain-containing protein [Clostridia bacterium]|nr:fibronectin type III domain-containing protein [Clostridia bacterium]